MKDVVDLSDDKEESKPLQMDQRDDRSAEVRHCTLTSLPRSTQPWADTRFVSNQAIVRQCVTVMIEALCEFAEAQGWMVSSHDDFLVVCPQPAAAAAASTSQGNVSSDAQMPQRTDTVVLPQVQPVSDHAAFSNHTGIGAFALTQLLFSLHFRVRTRQRCLMTSAQTRSRSVQVARHRWRSCE